MKKVAQYTGGHSTDSTQTFSDLDCRKGWQKERREPFGVVFPVFDTWLSCFETRPRIMLIRIDVGSLYPRSGVRLSLETSGQVWDYQMSPRIVSGGNIRISLTKTKTCLPPLCSPLVRLKAEIGWKRLIAERSPFSHCRGRGSVSIGRCRRRENRCPHTCWGAHSICGVCSTILLIKRIQPTI